MIQRSLNSVSRKFQGVIQGRFKGVSMELWVGFRGLKESQWVFAEDFQKCFKDVSRKFLGVFQGRLRDVHRYPQG